MTDFDTLIQQLDELLDKEHAALVSGDVQQLSQIVEEKETLIEQLNEAEFSAPEDMPDLTNKVHRNHALLEGALDGIRSAAKRLAELREVKKSLDTYDKNGRSKRIENETPGNLEKRA